MSVLIQSQHISGSNGSTLYRDDGSTLRVDTYHDVYITEETPNPDLYDIDVLFDITKSNSDECLVSGWASVAVNADGSLPLDWQDDVIRPEVLEKAAINFMLEYRDSGVMHTGQSKGTVVESIVFTKDKQKSIGIPENTIPEGWFITVKVLDKEVFNKVKNGTFKMFSIQGTGKRVAI